MTKYSPRFGRRTFLAAAGVAAAGFSLPGGAETAPLRIGIVGSDNTHAEHFGAILNLPEGRGGRRVEGARITHICGADPERTRSVAEAAAIPNALEDSRKEEMLGAVDAVICVRRDGSRHLEDAAPFLKAGLPVFVDKPLACGVADAEEIIALAQAGGAGFSSFSMLQYNVDTRAFLDRFPGETGPPSRGVITGPCDPDSPYCGVFFYGVHSVELMQAAFGHGCETVIADREGTELRVDCAYPGGLTVTLDLVHGRGVPFTLSAEGPDGAARHTLSTDGIYHEGLEIVIGFMRSGEWPRTPAALMETVRILAAIEASLATGARVRIA